MEKLIAQSEFTNKNLNEIQSNVSNFRFAQSSLGNIVSDLIPYILTLSGVLLLLFLISGGIRLMTSQGDAKATAAAYSQIMFAVIGFIVVFGAYWIAQLAGLALGLQPVIQIFK